MANSQNILSIHGYYIPAIALALTDSPREFYCLMRHHRIDTRGESVSARAIAGKMSESSVRRSHKALRAGGFM